MRLTQLMLLAVILLDTANSVLAQDNVSQAQVEAEIKSVTSEIAKTKAILQMFQGNVMLYPAIIKADGTTEPIEPGSDPTVAAARAKGTIVAVPVPVADIAEQLAMMMVLGEIKREKAKELIESFKENAATAKQQRADLQRLLASLESQLAALNARREKPLGNQPSNPPAVRPVAGGEVYDLYQANPKDPKRPDKGPSKPFQLTFRKLEGGKCAATIDLGKEFADGLKDFGIPQVVKVEGKQTEFDSYVAESAELGKLISTVAELMCVLPFALVPGAEKPAVGSKVVTARAVVRQDGDNLLVDVEYDVIVRVQFAKQPPKDQRVRDTYRLVGVLQRAK